jgi:hypothetical protein
VTAAWVAGFAATTGGWSAPLSAQEPAVRAYVTPGNTVPVGRPFVLNVEVSGVQDLDEEPSVPDLASFAQYLGSGTQTSMRSVNGRTAVSVTVQHRYQAVREGNFDIPAFDVVAGGRTLRTERLSLTVASSPQSGGGGDGAGDGGISSQDLFVTAEATKTRVRDGEPLVVEYRIWTRVDVGSFDFTRVPEPQGFWVEDVTPEGQPRVEQITRNGQSYTTAVVRRIALVPTGPGERTVEPVGLQVQVRVRRASPFGDIFGDPFFGGSSVVPTTVLSNPLTISVSPLPAGRPEPFSGVVGRLSLTATLDRDSVGADDAVTLTVRASGEGNLRAVPEPDLGLPGDFEVFPPETSESLQAFGPGLSGEKTFSYVVIPRAPGRREIPPIRMGYFDERAGAYRTASTSALPLNVTGVAGESPGDVARGGIATLREDIRFIHLGAGELERQGRTLFRGAAFWLVALLPVVGVVGAVGARRHRDLLEGDVAYARGRRASRLARKRLAEARRLAADADARAFYAEVARALRGLVADRLNLAEAGAQTAELEGQLRSRQVPESTVTEVRACLEHCDRMRFAPPGDDPHEKSRFLDRVGDVMTAVDKGIRR